MKKLFTYLAALMLVVGTGGLSTAQGGDITIYDNMNNWDFSQTPGGTVSPPNTYNPQPNLENNTVTVGAISNQNWDMEAVRYNYANKTLTLVGGWNWVTGGDSQGFTGIQTGDVFLAKGLANNFGHFVTEDAAGNPQSPNSLWNYAYVVQFGRDSSNNNHLDGSYKILSVDGTAVFNNISSSYPVEAQYWASPFTLASGGTVVYTSTTNFTQTSFTDGEGTHYVIDLNLSGIGSFLNDGFTSHVTMTCGNDVLAGNAAAPIPGSVLLLGSGLGLLGLGRRRKAEQS